MNLVNEQFTKYKIRGKKMEKVALVTGASRGIGKAIAIELAKNNYIVIVNYFKNETEAKKTLSEVLKYSDGCLIKADVSKVDDVAEMKKVIDEKYNRLDVLINNAGEIIRPGDWENISETDWDRTFDVNCKGTFNCIKVFAPLLKANVSSRIVNLASTVGFAAAPPVIAYSASKASVINITNAFAKALAPNVTVNAVAPGNIDTEMTQSAGEGLVKWVIDVTPMKRLGKPEEVAALVNFLCSDSASFITGQIIEIAGGYDLR